MSKISLGIDFGITNTDLVVGYHDQISYYSSPSKIVSIDNLKKIISQNNIELDDIETIGVTGGRHYDLPNTLNDIPITHFNELDAIGRGAQSLKKGDSEEFLVISAGSGTACVIKKDDQFIHAGGTGLGGGTIRGLCSLLIKENSPEKINKLSLKGDYKKVDLILKDVVSGPIGNLPGETSAVNFGDPEIHNANDADLAAGVINMVAQTILKTAATAAIISEISNILIIGRTSKYELLALLLRDGFDFLNLEYEFIENGEYAICLGTL
jgi:type II pantothenate kinase